MAAIPVLTGLSLNVATHLSGAAATTPAAAAAVADFGPAVGKVLQLAAAAVADDYPPGMDRAAAQQTLEVGMGVDWSPARIACAFIEGLCAAGLPAQQVEALQQHCLLPLIKLLGAAPRQYVKERCIAARAIAQLMRDTAVVAGWRLGGPEMLRTLAKALVDDEADVAAGWSVCILRIHDSRSHRSRGCCGAAGRTRRHPSRAAAACGNGGWVVWWCGRGSGRD